MLAGAASLLATQYTDAAQSPSHECTGSRSGVRTSLCDVQTASQSGVRTPRCDAELYAPEKVAVETERAAEIRQATADLNNEERLLHRVAHLRELVTWAEDLQQNLNATDVATDEPRQRFDDALALAVKVLAQSEDPEVPDKIVSLVDPDARRGRHGRNG